MSDDLLKIENYKILISNLPVRQQCFKTKRITWSKAENEIEWLKLLNDNLYRDKKSLIISRQDIFETSDIRELIAKTIYWGYMNGMRGNHFINILKGIELIENSLIVLKEKNNPNIEDFKELIKTFKNIKGLGLSTYSKLLYFLRVEFNHHPCLILDQRLIDIFAANIYQEFTFLQKMKYENAEKSYLKYLELMNVLSKDLGVEGENIELFLFTFGKHLKK